MKKCFISQQMAGLTSEEIQLKRNKIIEKVKGLGEEYEFIYSYITDPCPDDVNAGVWYLGKSITLLSKADLFVIPWDSVNSTGCNMEYTIARAYGIKTMIV